MAEAETTIRRERTVGNRWVGGAIGGFVAGVVFGLMIQFVMGIMPVIGAMYGMPGLASGWIAHLFHSVIFGLIYAGLAAVPSLAAYAREETTGAGLGAAYGVVVWLVAAGFVMPVWMSAVGLEAPPIPNLDAMSLVGHLVYGVVLGAAFAVVRR